VLTFYGRFLRINTVATATAIMIAMPTQIVIVTIVLLTASKLMGVDTDDAAGAATIPTGVAATQLPYDASPANVA
jgi:hypothetical protein